MKLGTRRLIAGLAVLGFIAVVFDLATGAQWLEFVEHLFLGGMAGG